MNDKVNQRFGLIKDNIPMAIRSIGWKRDKSIVLLGGWFGTRFADNSRFLYQYLSDNKEHYGLSHVVWVTRSENDYQEISKLGYEVYMMDSEESIRYHKKAGYHIICNAAGSNDNLGSDILTEYSWGAVRINLWHGVMPMKGVSMASTAYLNAKKNNAVLYAIKENMNKISFIRKLVQLPGGWGDCYYLSCTPAGTEIMKKFFDLPKSHYIETALPRFNASLNLTDEEKSVVNTIRKYKKNVLYLPTFRSNGEYDYYEAYQSVEKYLRDNNILWIQKLHSAVSNKTQNKKGNNILDLPASFDVNVIFPYVDLLITDYSSVAADAMNFYKPIVYYVPDFSDYAIGDRGFMLNPLDVMCGLKVEEAEKLRDALATTLDNPFSPDNKYQSVRHKYIGESTSMGEIWKTLKISCK